MTQTLDHTTAAPQPTTRRPKKKLSLGRKITAVGIGLFILGGLITALSGGSTTVNLPAGVNHHVGWTDAQMATFYDTQKTAAVFTGPQLICVINGFADSNTYTQAAVMSHDQLVAAFTAAGVDCADVPTQ